MNEALAFEDSSNENEDYRYHYLPALLQPQEIGIDKLLTLATIT
ncbi:MAG: hypothetical protein WCB31_10940 [Nitrososphaeraceae archaeon]